MPVSGELSEVRLQLLTREQLLECLLFVADGPAPIAQLAEALELSRRETEAALAALEAACLERGLRLQRWQDHVQLTTAPEAASTVERFLGLAATTRLSHAALETLAIVAYQQPVTRPQIEAVRGVNSDSVIKSLLSKGLLEEVGRSEGVGRPILYQTTPEFLQHFGLSALTELPPLNLQEALAQMTAAPDAPNGAHERGPAAAVEGAGEPAEAIGAVEAFGEIDSAPAAEAAARAGPAAEAETAPPREPLPENLPEVGTPESAAAEDVAGSEPQAAPSPLPQQARQPWQGDWAPVEEEGKE